MRPVVFILLLGVLMALPASIHVSDPDGVVSDEELPQEQPPTGQISGVLWVADTFTNRSGLSIDSSRRATAGEVVRLSHPDTRDGSRRRMPMATSRSPVGDRVRLLERFGEFYG